MFKLATSLWRTFLVAIFACVFIGGMTNAANAACGPNEIEISPNGCTPAKFSITTTPVSAGASFEFKMTAQGTFYVDWGDGTIDTIVRGAVTNEQPYSHVYRESGTYTIRWGGEATYYKFNVAALSFEGNQYIAGISGSLGRVLPTITPGEKEGTPGFNRMFANCSNLVGEIPEKLFDGVYGQPIAWQFRNMFEGTNLSGPIPAKLLADIQGVAKVGVFGHMFKNNPSLQGPLPDKLFAGVSGTDNYLYADIFDGCTGLTGSIPADIFGDLDGPPTTYLFRNTFSGCTNLSGAIPENLFHKLAGPVQTETFTAMFKNCENLSGYVPYQLFSKIDKGSTAYNFMLDIFEGSGIATSCEPFPYTKQYITGFESLWSGRVSCWCDDENAIKYAQGCFSACTVKQSLQLAGGNSYMLLAEKPTSPSLNFKFDSGEVCYVPMETGAGELNIGDGTDVWHAVPIM